MSALRKQLAAVVAARQALSEPPAEIVAARQEYERLERVLRQHRDSLPQAIEAYNQARRDVVIRWAKQHKQGWCSRGRHLVPAAELEGLITTGAYITSGYYEYLRDYTDRGTVCKDCRHKLHGGPGRYSGEFSAHATHELVQPLASLQAIAGSDYEIERLAKDHGIELPPKLRRKSDWDHTLVLGDREL